MKRDMWLGEACTVLEMGSSPLFVPRTGGVGSGGDPQLSPCSLAWDVRVPQAPSQCAEGGRASRTECHRLILRVVPLSTWPWVSGHSSCPAPGTRLYLPGTGDGAHCLQLAVPRVSRGAFLCPLRYPLHLPPAAAGAVFPAPPGWGRTAEQAQVGAEPCGSPLPAPPAHSPARQPLRQGRVPQCSWLVPSSRAQTLGLGPLLLPCSSSRSLWSAVG